MECSITHYVLQCILHTKAATNIRLLFWYPNVFLASGYLFNVYANEEIEHVKL